MQKKILAFILVLLSISVQSHAAQFYLARLDPYGCERVKGVSGKGVSGTEAAIQSLTRLHPKLIVENRGVIVTTDQHLVVIEIPGEISSVLVEGSEKDCYEFLKDARSKLSHDEFNAIRSASEKLNVRVVKGWGDDPGWQWRDKELRKFDLFWRAVNLGAPVDCTKIDVSDAKMIEKAFVGQVAHLRENGLPIVFMVRDGVQVKLMPIDSAGCQREAKKLISSQF